MKAWQIQREKVGILLPLCTVLAERDFVEGGAVEHAPYLAGEPDTARERVLENEPFASSCALAKNAQGQLQ